jgi:hypothetical protein
MEPKVRHMEYTTLRPSIAQEGESFKIVVNAEKMTWASQPPGHTITKPFAGYFSSGGAVGSGRSFEVFPDGTAQAVR